MELSNHQKREILKAIQAGRCSPEDITPAKHVTAIQREGEPFFEIKGEPVPLERLEVIKEELRESNAIRKELGLPQHSFTTLYFDNFGEKPKTTTLQ